MVSVLGGSWWSLLLLSPVLHRAVLGSRSRPGSQQGSDAGETSASWGSIRLWHQHWNGLREDFQHRTGQRAWDVAAGSSAQGGCSPSLPSAHPDGRLMVPISSWAVIQEGRGSGAELPQKLPALGTAAPTCATPESCLSLHTQGSPGRRGAAGGRNVAFTCLHSDQLSGEPSRLISPP